MFCWPTFVCSEILSSRLIRRYVKSTYLAFVETRVMLLCTIFYSWNMYFLCSNVLFRELGIYYLILLLVKFSLGRQHCNQFTDGRLLVKNSMVHTPLITPIFLMVDHHKLSEPQVDHLYSEPISTTLWNSMYNIPAQGFPHYKFTDVLPL